MKAYVDVGQTGLRVDTEAGRREMARAGEPLISDAAVGRLASDVIASAPNVDELHVGATGIASQSEADGLARELVARGTRRAIVASDRVAGYLGALGAQDGVTVTVGTGVVGFAVAAGRSATISGVGWAIDDEGGGFWIGRRGLLAALRGHDGRGPATALTARAIEMFGEPARWQARVARAGATVATVAGFVPAVAEAAADGDSAARRIWDDAAAVLRDVVSAAWRTARGNGSPAVAFVGGLVRAGDVFTGPLTARLAGAFASLTFVHDASLLGVHSLERQLQHPGIGPYIAVSEAS